MKPQQLSTWRGLARKGKLNIPIPEEDFPAFAALEVVEEAPADSGVPIEIEAGDVTIRLAASTSAIRIAEIVAALRSSR